ncbi:MAG: hypothetical protein ACKPGT_20590 [Microcystis sp.]
MNKQINHQPNSRYRWLISRLFFRNVALLGLTTLFVGSAAIAHAKLPSDVPNIATKNIEQFSLARNPSSRISNLKVSISYQIAEKQASDFEDTQTQALVETMNREIAVPYEISLSPQEILIYRILEVISANQYQPGYLGADKTWCNQAALTILKDLGYDTTPLLRSRPIIEEGRRPLPPKPDQGYTTANDIGFQALMHVTEQTGKVNEVLPQGEKSAGEVAQDLANQGIPVLAAEIHENYWQMNPDAKIKSGHVAIVAPWFNNYDSKLGPLIGQAGRKNGFFFAHNIFGNPTRSNSKLSGIKYYVLDKISSPTLINPTLFRIWTTMGGNLITKEGLDNLFTLTRTFYDLESADKTRRISVLNPDGLPPAPPSESLILPLDISEAVKRGEIEVEAEGTGNPSSLRLRITNKNPDRWMQIGIPPGTTFNPGTLNTQNMMIR